MVLNEVVGKLQLNGPVRQKDSGNGKQLIKHIWNSGLFICWLVA